MIGGAGDSVFGLRATATSTIRNTFVNNIYSLVQNIGFDGIDMDWEPFVPASDGPILTALMTAFQAAGVMPRSRYIYTMPVGINNANFNDMVDPIFGTLASTYFDRLNIMSYEMCGIWDGWKSWYFSPLYGQTPQTPSSIDNTVSALKSSGVPSHAIGIGAGFYGQAFENGKSVGGSFQHLSPPAIPAYVTGPYQSIATAAIRYTPTYSDIMRYIYQPSAYVWDATAKASYLTFSSPKTVNIANDGISNLETTYVTYDDVQSVTEKGNYIKSQGLGGLIIWTISGGFLAGWKTGPPSVTDPLMQAVKSVLIV